VKNLDLGYGHNGGGPAPEAAPRKGWRRDPGVHTSCPPNIVKLVSAAVFSGSL
jgi:hypothetical protein